MLGDNAGLASSFIPHVLISLRWEWQSNYHLFLHNLYFLGRSWPIDNSHWLNIKPCQLTTFSYSYCHQFRPRACTGFPGVSWRPVAIAILQLWDVGVCGVGGGRGRRICLSAVDRPSCHFLPQVSLLVVHSWVLLQRVSSNSLPVTPHSFLTEVALKSQSEPIARRAGEQGGRYDIVTELITLFFIHIILKVYLVNLFMHSLYINSNQEDIGRRMYLYIINPSSHQDFVYHWPWGKITSYII